MNAERGFTLLETLVAFAILSLSLGIILQIFSLSAQTSRSVEIQQRALAIAQSQIDQELAQLQLNEGEDRGRVDERFSWSSEIRRYQFPDQEGRINDQIQAYRITVSVRWDDSSEQALSLSTIRLQRQ
ncbi:type IV pilus modification PilV family protein [Amphritea balenae]|uniref:Prepilin-type N-terminal cleavage/methylation domain-containing protein n=1 Tax=Amphritea balenae TaxID=452629 RepID=A0A3P1SI22_9GAMM|nr:type II secretion system protein [Amphritea balenae]RRC96788.1 prepilin-type N-terminal cleavage/methylation domain-containing protein [Amphritea balenae]GGK84848.1 hypothetical protein GCM10007941_39220 [Amphritea balenae]